LNFGFWILDLFVAINFSGLIAIRVFAPFTFLNFSISFHLCALCAFAGKYLL
jgi:hypothetical protein